jgi:hypothetical protein
MGDLMNDADLRFDPHQFADHVALAVSADTSIAFSDYRFMHTKTRKLNCARMKEPLPWAFDDRIFREVLVRYLESRAYQNLHLCRAARNGTQEERMARAVAKLKERTPRKIEVLTGLCKQFAAEKANPEPDHARLRQLETSIRSLDGEVRTAERPAEIMCGVRYFYFHCGCDSVETAQRLLLTPWGVRQLIWRLDRIYKRMIEEQQKPGTRPGKCAQ